MTDIHGFAFMTLPFTCLFWRIPRDEVVVHHRHPIVEPELGIGYDSFAGDNLHTGHLGTWPAWMTRALWCLFRVDAFDSRATRAEDALRHNALALKTLVAEWYPQYEATIPPARRGGMTRVSNITPSMLGKADWSSQVSFKAAENRHFLPFVLHLVGKFRGKLATLPNLDVAALEGSGQKLIEWQDLVNSEPRKMSREAARRLVELMDEHNRLAMRAGVRAFPKHHMAVRFCCWK